MKIIQTSFVCIASLMLSACQPQSTNTAPETISAAELREMTEDARSRRLRFAFPQSLAAFVATKGSVCLNGVSLTVNDVGDEDFGVNIVPHTLEVTTLGELRPGAQVNIEVDVVARYLERMLSVRGALN